VAIPPSSLQGELLIAYKFLTATNASPLKAGMTISNEPGYYADGRFGIRIESIVLVREVKTPNNFGDKGFLGFECVTMCVFFSII
jgi:Xaa-Pro aminopeptidase